MYACLTGHSRPRSAKHEIEPAITDRQAGIKETSADDALAAHRLKADQDDAVCVTFCDMLINLDIWAFARSAPILTICKSRSLKMLSSRNSSTLYVSVNLRFFVNCL